MGLIICIKLMKLKKFQLQPKQNLLTLFHNNVMCWFFKQMIRPYKKWANTNSFICSSTQQDIFKGVVYSSFCTTTYPQRVLELLLILLALSLQQLVKATRVPFSSLFSALKKKVWFYLYYTITLQVVVGVVDQTDSKKMQVGTLGAF